jgi:hypothetical protein
VLLFLLLPRNCVSRSSNSSMASVSAISIGSSPSLFTAATSDLFSIRYLIHNSKQLLFSIVRASKLVMFMYLAIDKNPQEAVACRGVQPS